LLGLACLAKSRQNPGGFAFSFAMTVSFSWPSIAVSLAVEIGWLFGGFAFSDLLAAP